MVQESIVLGHPVSSKHLEVDQEKIATIKNYNEAYSKFLGICKVL